MNTISKLRGLTAQQVTDKIAAGQVNTKVEKTSRSLSEILRANLFTRFNALLAFLFIIVLAVGSPLDGLFGFLVVINSAIGIFQELRAKRTLDRLAILNTPVAHVIRDGKTKEIAIHELVIDDVVQLQIGDQIAADGVVLQSENLEIDEALLTGESDPIVKTSNAKVLSGSFVVAGHGFMRVTAVGADAYAQKISAEAKRFKRTRSELIDGTNKLLKYISWILVVVAPLLVWAQITQSGASWQEATVRSIGAITGMIPEGLVLLTSLAFMLATLALARRKVLVQQLPAVEGLARVDVICLDKTGTLTEDKIVFDELIPLDHAQYEAAKQVLATFSDDPNSATLRALHEAFTTEKPLVITNSVAFSSARKWSSITTDGTSWIMGAPEIIWPDTNNSLRQKAAAIAATGKRVLALVQSTSKPSKDKLPKDSTAVALITLREKIRDDAAETLRYFAEQQVTLKIISGDNPITVAAVAEAVGLPKSTPIDARTLPSDQSELIKVLETNSIFGRVTPEQKRAIVQALQANGHTVAMTGDGVNDALALKDADIGIAMGNGSQASKATAELVLLDNKFSHMPKVLAEGRRVIANIERVANLYLIKNVYAMVTALAVIAASIPYPFLPRHMTIISSLTIGIPSFFLALAPNNQRYRPGFLMRILKFSVPVGVITALLVFAAYVILQTQGASPQLISTTGTTILLIIGIWTLFCLARPLKVWKVTLIVAMAAAFILLLSLPIAHTIFALGFGDSTSALPLAFGFGAVGAVAVELLWRYDQKQIARRHSEETHE